MFSRAVSRVTFVGLYPDNSGCRREDYPIVKAAVHYDVSDVQMFANLVQTYVSCAAVDSEIRYVFPLPPDASVCAFKAVIDGKRTIKGIVKEKATAKAEYDQAIAQGMTAGLLEQHNVEIFQISLGNIKPRQTIDVHISFVEVISHDGNNDSLRLTFPNTIAPRYGTPPSGLFGSVGVIPPKNSLEFSVAVEMTSHIKSITSPSHPVSVNFGVLTIEPSDEFDPKKARISLASSGLLEKDIVLVLNSQGLDKPRCMVESFTPEEGGEEYTDAYALTLVPRFNLPQLPSQEYIFLVDRSGSMGGGKIKAVRSALQILLASLPSRGTTFNIISFGSRHTSLWPCSVTYLSESVKDASQHVDTMNADHGGTEIRTAIETAFACRAANVGRGTSSTSVFVLTDGEAWDLDGVRSAIQDAVTQAKAEGSLLRVFCMGIGNAVSKAMCDAIARAGKGTVVFVGEEEKPDQKLISLLRSARGAIVEDISIDWGVGEEDLPDTDQEDFEMVSEHEEFPKEDKDSAPISLFDESHTTSTEDVALGPQSISVKLLPPPRIQQAPSSDSIPPLYPGFRTSVFAIVKRRANGNESPSKCVRIKGTVGGQPVTLEVPVTQTSIVRTETAKPIKMLHSLAARALIQSIEDSKKHLVDVHKAEVVRLATRYGLASSETSFVAIDGELEHHPVVADAQSPQQYTNIHPHQSFSGFGSLPQKWGSVTTQSNLPLSTSFGAPAANTRGPLFGSVQDTRGPLFGSAQGTRGPLFGSAQGTRSSGVSGEPATHAPTSVSFGSSGLNTPFFSTGQAAKNPSSGVFGTPAASTPSPGVFGAPVVKTRSSSVRFGSQVATGFSGSFGSASNTHSSGSFGSASNTHSPGSFGSASNTHSSGSFGSASNTHSSGSFGSASNTHSPGSFGSASNTHSSGSFGSASNTHSSGVFGAQTTPTPSSGLFGAPGGNTLLSGVFGAPAAHAPSSGVFGAPAANAPSSGVFGAPAANAPSSGVILFGTSPSFASSSGPFGAPPPTAALSPISYDTRDTVPPTSLTAGVVFGSQPATSTFGTFSGVPFLVGSGVRREEDHSKKQQITVETFARAQSFDGSFPGSSELFQILIQQPTAPVNPAALNAIAATNLIKETMWCTLLCVAHLEVKFASEKDVWVIIVEKALQFVKDCLEESSTPTDAEELVARLLEDAKRCLG